LEAALDTVKGAVTDAGRSVFNSAANAVTGMEEKERDELMGRLSLGQNDFNDYLKMIMLMKERGGIGGLASSLGSIPGIQKAVGLDEEEAGKMGSEEKLQAYAEIIAAMPEEYRGSPGFYLYSESKEDNINKLKEACGQDPELVDRFFDEFEKQQYVFKRLSAGVREGREPEQVMKEITMEMDEKEKMANLAKLEEKYEPAITAMDSGEMQATFETRTKSKFTSKDRRTMKPKWRQTEKNKFKKDYVSQYRGGAAGKPKRPRL
jgi:hypothetical protein